MPTSLGLTVNLITEPLLFIFLLLCTSVHVRNWKWAAGIAVLFECKKKEWLRPDQKQIKNLSPRPPTPLKPQMKVDFVWMWVPHMGNARNLRYSRAPLRAPGAAATGFHFQLEHARVVVCLHHAGGRRRFRLGVSSSVGHCCQHFWVGWGPNQIKGGLRRGKCQRYKQALQIFLGRLQLDDADVVVYKGSKTPRPFCRAVERACFGCTWHLSPRETWQEVHVSVGLAHLCIVVSLIGVTATRLFCALQRWCFLQLGKTYPTTKGMLGIPKDLVW